jgi:hypothetical protein
VEGAGHEGSQGQDLLSGLPKDNPHYQLIANFYGDRRARRSGQRYMKHIDLGLGILERIGASVSAMEAYCLHPILQGDQELSLAVDLSEDGGFGEAGLVAQLSPRALILGMEYRAIANGYLSTRIIENVEDIVLSPLVEVQWMLIADKVQNRRDFELYQSEHPRVLALAEYFNNWLRRLEVSEQDYQRLIEHS